MFAVARADVDPSLLDVVPWSHGYAHSWALAALLSDQRTAEAILAAMPGLPGRAPHRLIGGVRRESPVPRARADLSFVVRDADGAEHTIAVETKVNDPFRPEQLTAYNDAGCTPLLFLPGLTGLLVDVTPLSEAGEVRLPPPQLLQAIDMTGLTFATLLDGYLNELRAESDRMDRAVAQARGEAVADLGDGRSAAATLEDVAWLAETYRALPAACVDTSIDPKAEMRIEANDRGFFFTGSFRWVLDGSALWADVIADVRTSRRSVAIKAGERDVAAAWDLAASGREGPSPDWRLARRRVGGATATIWKRDLDDVPPPEAAREAVRAAEFIHALPA